MKTILRNIAAVILGLVFGSVVNTTLIVASPHVIPPPADVEVSRSARMKEPQHLYEPKHFLFPFLAHALGAFVGALVAFFVAGSRRHVFAYTVGGLFFAGGIAACFMIPAPAWFMALDLLAAYFPMAWLAILLGRRLTEKTRTAP